MSLELRMRGETHSATVEALGGQSFRVCLDGQELLVEAINNTEGLLHLLVEGQSFEVSLGKGDPLVVGVYDDTFEVTVRDERERMFEALGGASGSAGPAEVKSPMPGRIVEYRVAVGDLVEEGQPVVVVEAMKMENVLKAPRAGRVARVGAAAGASVESGQMLLLVEDVEE